MPLWSTSVLIACAAAALVLGCCFLLLLRQVGSIELRLDALVPGGVSGGPALGPLGTGIRLRDLDGVELELGKPLARPLVLLFVAHECSKCADLVPRLGDCRADGDSAAEVVLVSDVSAAELRSYLARQRVSRLRAFSSPELLRGWGIQQVPYAVAVGADGAVAKKGLVEGIDDLSGFLAPPDLAVTGRGPELVRRA
jgi:methylamine dehydrogenase accessory protein MauD